jgi:CRISPR-associated endonuclease Csn1
MKKILGLDLGVTSVGWAFVKEAEDSNEKSSIERVGVRIINYGDNLVKVDRNGKVSASLNPEEDFQSGKSLSPNAERRIKRGARRNLQRYKQRRSNLIEALLKIGFINANTSLAEDDRNTTHSTYALRSKAATGLIEKTDLARVLLMINKKRGYKSSRNANTEDEGRAIDGMEIAKKLYDEDLTPGEYSYKLLNEGKKYLPDYYRSDLKAEFERIWAIQNKFYPNLLNEEFKKEIAGKGHKATSALFWTRHQINIAETKGTREEKKIKGYEWRVKSLREQLDISEAAFVISELNNNINNSSGYLGAISDRSKELYFNKETIGQYLFKQIQKNPHTRIKNQVFYRQDYLDEFEKIWETQAEYYPELNAETKTQIRDIIIFYQRRLKSQKGLISYCEFENKKVEVEVDGKKKIKMRGSKVIPKSSPLFQEFKIWQNLNNLLIQDKKTKEILVFNSETKQQLFDELNIKGNLSKMEIFQILNLKPADWNLNYKIIEGNRTNQALYDSFKKMMQYERDEINFKTFSAIEIKENVLSFFESEGINTEILQFNPESERKDFEKQQAYQFWHLLYSCEGDQSYTGNDTLYKTLKSKYGFKKEYAQILANISFQSDYGSLSSKAITKIFPFIKENKYDEACRLAGYNHSSSITTEENKKRELKDRLDILPKNCLRNPIVEKILNQMVNVINAIIADPKLGKPDEIRIELARELKKNAKEREEMTNSINAAKLEHDKFRKILINEFGIRNPTRNDIIKYKLYEELKNNGYKDLYTNIYIPREKLFSKEFDIEHIIPKSRLFDNSFSNKTLSPRQFNLDKKDETAYDFIKKNKGEERLSEFMSRVEMLSKFDGDKFCISKAKYKKLLMKSSDIGEGFIERDLRDSQYIAKKAKQMLGEVCRTITTTTGSITDRLREDWDLINVMQELNIDKYRKLGLTEIIENKGANFKERLKGWTKRNDHRHHAMDAITLAFTKRNHIDYLNNLNARSDRVGRIYGIEQKETYKNADGKRIFKAPLLNFREVAKKHLENILISFKANNKVVTKNKNIIKFKGKTYTKIEQTPRGQLHKETIYSRIQQYDFKIEKIGSKFNEQNILKVAKPAYRLPLLNRLRDNNHEAKIAFTGKNSFNKNPIFLDEQKIEKVPEKLKIVWMENNYTIRKELTPDLFKDSENKDDFINKIESIYDNGIREALKERYYITKKEVDQFNATVINNKEKKKVLDVAFGNLYDNPIWLNKDKGISIKHVTISAIKNGEALHNKKDHHGKEILNENGQTIPADFVSLSKNHHVAIYKDGNNVLQEKVVSFFEAVVRLNQGLPIVDKNYNNTLGWQFLFTMKRNECFVFPSADYDPSEIDLLNPLNNKLISPHLFRVQTISILKYGNNTIREFKFRNHLETSVENKRELKDISYIQVKSLPPLEKIIKVRINHLGQIVKVGEY